MQNQLEMTSGKMGNLTSFVRDVANMEVSYYTLTESARQARNNAEKDKQRTTGDLAASKERLQSASNRLNKAKTDLRDISTFNKYFFKNKMTGPKDFFAALAVFIFTFGFFGGVATPLLSGLLECLILGVSFDECKFTFFLPALICVLIIYLLIVNSIYQKDYKLEYEKKEEIVDQCLKRYNDALNTVKEHEEKFNSAKELHPILTKRADELDYSAKEVRRNLDSCYDLGIIPPSYRNLVCAVLLADVFMNNKADTIREAVLLCDVEIRHAEIVNKLTDINYSLQSLAASIHSIGGLLQDINRNISTIGKSVTSQQEKIAYAADSMKQSMDNVEFYINQKRAENL